MKGLPKRPLSHIIGEQAVAALRNVLPPQWICREMSNDYGIDCEIEAVENDGTVTGGIVKVQVKGTASNVNIKKYGISVSIESVRYWVLIPVPTIIVRVVDNPKEVLWLNIREYLILTGQLEDIYSTRKKSIYFNFNKAKRLPKDLVELDEIIKSHQADVLNMKEASENVVAADYIGYCLLVKKFDNDPDKMINWLREKGSLEQLVSDLPFAVWIKKQAEEDSGFLERVKRMVIETAGEN
jgi:hypothetical protein